jgi:RNA polymerase sigma-70 factor (ECF subfamily)
MATADERLEEFLRNDYRRCVVIVSLLCDNVQTAEDCVAEAAAGLYAQLAKGSQIDNPAAWVVAVASNHARSLRRRAAFARRKHHLLTTQSTVPDPADVLRNEPLMAAVGRLPPRQRHAVVRHYLLDQPIKTIADAVGVSEGAIKNALFEARRSLAAALEGLEEQPR